MVDVALSPGETPSKYFKFSNKNGLWLEGERGARFKWGSSGNGVLGGLEKTHTHKPTRVLRATLRAMLQAPSPRAPSHPHPRRELPTPLQGAPG